MLYHADPSIDVEAGEDKYRYSLALAALHEGPILKALLDTGLVGYLCVGVVHGIHPPRVWHSDVEPLGVALRCRAPGCGTPM